jgi:hypothetical protein
MDTAVRHVVGSTRMIKDLPGDENTVSKWIGAVDADLRALRLFTAGLRRDLNARRSRTDPGVQLRRRRRQRQPRVKQLKAAMYGAPNPTCSAN